MVFHVTETWKAVADAKWGNRSCNAGIGFGTLATIGNGENVTGRPSAPEQLSSAVMRMGDRV